MSRFRAVVAAGLCFIFTFTNVVFATLPQQSVWAERTRKTPAPIALSLPFESAQRSTSNVSPNGFPAAFFSRLTTLEQHRGVSDRPIVLLQDVHGNAEAQRNIATALLALRGLKDTTRVGLEGAAGSFVYDRFHDCPAPAAARSVVDKLFVEQKISGPAYAGLSAFPQKGFSSLLFRGIDDAVSYRKNVDAYRTASRVGERVKKQLERRLMEMDREKRQQLNPALLAFDSSVLAYERGELPMARFVDVLAAQTTELPPAVQAFRSAHALEGSLNLTRVETERSKLLQQLVARLSAKQRQRLMWLSVASKNNEITSGEYYRQFRALCASVGLDLNTTPAFGSYVQYALLVDNLNANEISTGIRTAQSAIYARLTRNAQERALLDRSFCWTLARVMTEFALTPDQWNQYRTLKHLTDLDLSAFESFYEQADIRSDKMVENVAAFNPNVIVVGGFHSDRIKTQLAARGYSYVVASPKITHVNTTEGAAYLAAFDREKTSLAEIFFGRKLFLSPPVVGAEVPLVDAKVVTNAQLAESVVNAALDVDPTVTEFKLTQWRDRVLNSRAADMVSRSYSNPTTTNLTPDQEISLLREFLSEVKSGRPMPVATLSDPHGTIDKFDELLMDAVGGVLPEGQIPDEFQLKGDQSIESQLNMFGVTLHEATEKYPITLQKRIFFHNMGDWPDRGEHFIQVAEHSMELVEAGLSSFVIGNHDKWMFMNLLGFHLPWYEGYEFYSYADQHSSEHGRVVDVLAKHHASDPETRKPQWWAEKYYAYVQSFMSEGDNKQWAKDVEMQINGTFEADGKTRIPGTGLYEKVAASFAANPKSNEARMWNKLRGWYLVDIYTGVRGIDGMSVRWWEDLSQSFERVIDEIKRRPGFDEKNLTSEQQAWFDAYQLIRFDILFRVRLHLKAHLDEGHWWFRIFEAINYHNYTSAEWWAKDWILHKDWGTAALKELNAMGVFGDVTPANYLNNPILTKIGRFMKGNYALYQRDAYQNTYMHAFLPIDMDTGEFYFTYKGVQYRGKGRNGFPSVWEGMDLIAADVRTSKTPREMHEAFELVNSWYADNTTRVKSPDVADAINTFGADRLMDINGINVLFTGHLPMQEFTKLKNKRGVIDGFQVGGRIVFADGGMGERFGGLGVSVSISGEGVHSRGFQFKDSKSITSNPKIIYPPTDRDNPGTDTPISGEMYRPQVVDRINARLAHLEDGKTEPVLSHRSVLNRFELALAFAVPSSAMIPVGLLSDNFFVWVACAISWSLPVLFLHQGASLISAARASGVGFWSTRHASVAHAARGYIYVNWQMLEELSFNARVSALEEELRHVRIEARSDFFRKNHRFVKAIEEVVVNLAQQARYFYELIRSLAGYRNSTTVVPELFALKGFQTKQVVDVLSEERSPLESMQKLWSRVPGFNRRFLADWPSVRMVKWKLAQEAGGRMFVLETLFIDSADGRIVGAAQFVSQPNGTLVTNIASLSHTYSDIVRKTEGWLMDSNTILLDAVVEDDDSDFGDDTPSWMIDLHEDEIDGQVGTINGDEIAEPDEWNPELDIDFEIDPDDDNSDGSILYASASLPLAMWFLREGDLAAAGVTLAVGVAVFVYMSVRRIHSKRTLGEKEFVSFLRRYAPQGKLIGDVRALDLRNTALSGYVRYVKRQPQHGLASAATYALLAYLNARGWKPGFSMSAQISALRSASLETAPVVRVYHVNQLGDASVFAQELLELQVLINDTQREMKANHGFSADVVVALHGTLTQRQQKSLARTIGAARGLAQVVRVTNDVLSGDTGVYSYTKLLRKAAVSTAGSSAVRKLLETHAGVRLQTFTKIPTQFVADEGLEAVWQLLVNIGLGWAPMSLDTVLKSARRAGVSA